MFPLDAYASIPNGPSYKELPDALVISQPLGFGIRSMAKLGLGRRECGATIGLHAGNLEVDVKTLRFGTESEVRIPSQCFDPELHTVGHVHTHPLEHGNTSVDGSAHSPTDLFGFSRLSLAFSLVISGLRLYLVTRTSNSVPTIELKDLAGRSDRTEETFQQIYRGRMYGRVGLFRISYALIEKSFPQRVPPELETLLEQHGIKLETPVRAKKMLSYMWVFTWGGKGQLFFIRDGQDYVVSYPMSEEQERRMNDRFPRMSTVYRVRVDSRAYGYGFYKGSIRDLESDEPMVLNRQE